MGIYIPNMEMPKTCVQCDLKFYDPEMRWDENGIEQIGAWVCKRTREIIWNTQRGENCPLVPLPEKYGRLIDADALQKSVLSQCEMVDAFGVPEMSQIAELIKNGLTQEVGNAETIIEAEGGSEDG